MNKKILLIPIVTIVAVFALSLFSQPQSNKLHFNSVVCVYKNGVQVGECSHNTMMNSGLNWTRDLIGNGLGSGAVNVIAVGNGTSAEVATQTTLNGEITDCSLGRATGSYQVQTISQGNWSISKVFTSNCAASEVVNTTGLFNASSSGTMFSGKNFAASVTLANGDQLNVSWYLWVS
jgi:hypothetical protein